MEINFKLIGERIRFIRLKKGVTQEELAEFADVSQVYISSIERGEKSPSLKTIIAIANALNITTDSILKGSLISEDSQYEDIFSLLYDCSAEEINIILSVVKSLKHNLRN